MTNPETIEEAQKLVQTWIEEADPTGELGNLQDLLSEVRLAIREAVDMCKTSTRSPSSVSKVVNRLRELNEEDERGWPDCCPNCGEALCDGAICIEEDPHSVDVVGEDNIGDDAVNDDDAGDAMNRQLAAHFNGEDEQIKEVARKAAQWERKAEEGYRGS